MSQPIFKDRVLERYYACLTVKNVFFIKVVPTPKSRHGKLSNQLRQKILIFAQSQVQSIIRRVRTAPFATPQNGEPRLRFSRSDIAPVSVRTGPAPNPVTV